MSFPFDGYNKVLGEAHSIVLDRDRKGRNSASSFYAGFPHGSQDVSFELSRRVWRILGSEVTKGAPDVRRGDALDLLNYAAFYVMLLDREATSPEAQTAPTTPPTHPLRSI